MADNKNHTDQLERLFRMKAEDYDIRFREEDWNKLEPKLDLQDARIAYRRKVRLLAAALFLVVSLVGYFTYDNYNRLNQISEQLTDEQLAVPQLPPVIGEFPSADSETDEAAAPEAAAAIDPLADLQSDRTGTGDVDPAASNQTAIESIDPEHTDHKTVPVSREGTGLVDISRLAYSQSDMNRKALHPASMGQRAVHQPEDIISPVTVSEAKKLVQASPVYETVRGEDHTSRFSFNLVTAPDMSTVSSLSNFSDPGYKFGVTLEYSLTSRLSISAGVLQTLVKYSAQSSQYNPPVYWAGGISPDEMAAECLLFDIPVTVKYNFLNFNRSRFFATAGLSSYFMQSEDYFFSYNEEVPGQAESWSGRTGTRHWLSNAGFSIGYEFDIRSNWSLRAEPFMKIPLKEVGWGNVKLYSTGSFISLNYRL